MKNQQVVTAENLHLALHREMERVDDLRMKLDPHRPADVWIEFMMRRAILRARFALNQNNMHEMQRMWRLLLQIGQ
jgi:hypothetical protein